MTNTNKFMWTENDIVWTSEKAQINWDSVKTQKDQKTEEIQKKVKKTKKNAGKVEVETK